MSLAFCKRVCRIYRATGLRIALLAFCGMLVLTPVPGLHAAVSQAQLAQPAAQGTGSTNAASNATTERQSKRQAERQEEIRQKKIDNPEAEEGENVYRHSAMVKTLAHMFGLSTETTARLFEAINFIILMAAILWFVVRMLPKTLRNRSERIQRDLQQARSATEDANRRLAGVEERLARLDDEIEALKTQAEHETVQEEERLRATLEQERQLILNTAGQEIRAASLNAQRQLKNLAAELVIEHARRSIAVNAETDRSLMEGFLNDVTQGDSHKKNSSGGVN